MDVVTFLWSRGCPRSSDSTMRAAASKGHIDCMRFLHANGVQYGWGLDQHAFAGGHIDCMRFLHEHGCSSIGWYQYINAVEAVDLDVFRDVLAGRTHGPWMVGAMCRRAASKGRADVLGLIASLYPDHDHSWDADVCSAAATGGHLDTLRYAHTNGWPLCSGPKTMAIVAAAGHLTTIQYLCDNGCTGDKRACLVAAANGHVDVLRYLHNVGCVWDRHACIEAAAAGGRLEILRYCREEKGCPWHPGLALRAAAGGHIRCLRYLCDTGCPLDAETYAAAVASGRRACLAYLDRRGCPRPANP